MYTTDRRYFLPNGLLLKNTPNAYQSSTAPIHHGEIIRISAVNSTFTANLVSHDASSADISRIGTVITRGPALITLPIVGQANLIFVHSVLQVCPR